MLLLSAFLVITALGVPLTAAPVDWDDPDVNDGVQPRQAEVAGVDVRRRHTLPMWYTLSGSGQFIDSPTCRSGGRLTESGKLGDQGYWELWYARRDGGRYCLETTNTAGRQQEMEAYIGEYGGDNSADVHGNWSDYAGGAVMVSNMRGKCVTVWGAVGADSTYIERAKCDGA